LPHLDRESLPQLVHFLGGFDFVFERVFDADSVRIGGDDFDVSDICVEIQEAARSDLKRLLNFIAPLRPGARSGEDVRKSEKRDQRKDRPASSFPNSVWRRNCPGHSVAPPAKQSFGTRNRTWG
jgi:hypothetical protein